VFLGLVSTSALWRTAPALPPQPLVPPTLPGKPVGEEPSPDAGKRIGPLTPTLTPTPTPTPTAQELQKGLSQLAADLAALQAGLDDVYTALREMVGEATEETKQLRSEVAEAAKRLRSGGQELRTMLEEAVKAAAETPTIRPRYEVLPARVDPRLASSAERYLNVLRTNSTYRNNIAALVSDAAVVDDIEDHLSSLRHISSSLHAYSRVVRGEGSPRMQAWARDNGQAETSFLGVRPLLRRLQRLSELEAGNKSAEGFLNGLHERELTAMGVFLAADPLSGDQQVRTALDRAAKAVIRQWLIPTIHLYQLVHEALRVEDREAYASVADVAGRADAAAGRSHPVDTFRAAASTLGFRYVHHELYGSTDLYSMKADLTPATPRYTFAEWIAGETADAGRNLPVAKDCLGRVTIPRFEDLKGQGTIQTEIIIIKGDS
jgi:hypothetical protein